MNKNSFIKIFFLLSVLILMSCNKNEYIQDNIKVGGGEVQDIYNPAAKVVARIINSDFKLEDYLAEPVETKGSLDNIRKILNGELTVGFANQVSAYAVYYGKDGFKKLKDHSKLRSIISLFPEYLFLVVQKNSSIISYFGIKGKVFGVTQAGMSAASQLGNDISEYYKISNDDNVFHRNNLDVSIKELEDRKIEGFFYLSAQPNPSIYAIMHSKKISPRFVEMNDDLFQYLKKKYPFINKEKITKQMYPNSSNKTDIETLMSRAVLVCDSEENDDLVYQLTKDVFENFSAFKKVHESFKDVTRKTMVEYLTIPVHPGALRYYKQIGYDKYIPKNLLPKEQ